MKNLSLTVVWIVWLAADLVGCSTPQEKVPSYRGLTSNGQIEEAQPQALSLPRLAKETAFLVTGANYERYSADWKKEEDHLRHSTTIALLNSREQFLEMHRSTSPQAITAPIVVSLKKYFSTIQTAQDFSDARARAGKWIVLIDFASANDGYVTTIDLLDASFHRVIHTEKFAATDSVPFSWSDDQITRDVVLVNSRAIRKSVTTTTDLFERKIREIAGSDQ